MFNKQLIAALCVTAASATTIRAITDEVDLTDTNNQESDIQLAQVSSSEKVLRCIEFDSEADFEASFRVTDTSNTNTAVSGYGTRDSLPDDAFGCWKSKTTLWYHGAQIVLGEDFLYTNKRYNPPRESKWFWSLGDDTSIDSWEVIL